MAWSARMQEPVDVIPEGEYDAALTGVGEQHALHGPASRFEFRLSSGGGTAGRTVTGLSGTLMAENTKKGRWVAAILGRVPDIGEDIAEKELLGRFCRIRIAHKVDAKGVVRANVADVFPVAASEDEDDIF